MFFFSSIFVMYPKGRTTKFMKEKHRMMKRVCVCMNKNYEKSTNINFFVVLCEVIRQSPRYDIEK
jgi:hypothetical protein